MIQKDKYYSVMDLHKARTFPFIKSYHTLRKWIDTDIRSGNNGLFKAIKKGKGYGARYYILGEHIINTLKDFKSGKVL